MSDIGENAVEEKKQRKKLFYSNENLGEGRQAFLQGLLRHGT